VVSREKSLVRNRHQGARNQVEPTIWTSHG